MIIRSFSARLLSGVTLAASLLGLASCGQNLYKFPQYTFANRPIPPSQLANRVMVGLTSGFGGGRLQILDANRDIRSNVQNTIPIFGITGYGGAFPSTILNFPEQSRGFVYSPTDGSFTIIDYGKESAAGNAASFPARSSGITIADTFAAAYSAEETAGIFVVADIANGRNFTFNLPAAYRVFTNQGNTIVLVMTRNNNNIYRLVKLNSLQVPPPGATDCQPVILPVYCVVPVPGSFDRPTNAYFSLDGSNVYVLNSGPEYSGTTASVSVLNTSGLTTDTIPTAVPYPSPVVANIPLPGGATVALASGNTLYVAGQQRLPDGLFAGNLSTISLTSNTVTGKYSISDGTHTKMLFADDNTLWIGSQFCATGERAKLGQNYNCLTRFDLGKLTAAIIPAVTPGSSTAVVPYPNGDNNQYYYGDLTGLCWVQNLHKIYTAYGGQVHAFNTLDGSEINNQYITVQGTALDVAYMDALTNAAN